MAWIPRGHNDSGLVQSAPHGESISVPSIATHRGSLWCLWSSPAGDLHYSIGNNDTFGPRELFPDQGQPVLAELLGTLHAVVVRENGDVAHWEFDDEAGEWELAGVVGGVETQGTPALISFHDRLVLVFVRDCALWYSMWRLKRDAEGDEQTRGWTAAQEMSGIQTVKGIPALFVMSNVLHCLCGSEREENEVLGFSYDLPKDVWNACADVTEGRAVYGVSATSYGSSAFLAFQEAAPSGRSHNAIFLTEFKDGAWHAQESIGEQFSADPPQLAVLNGRINCVFNGAGEGRGGELRWFSRALLDFELGSWMRDLADDRLLSDITVPGTHDSCARSNIPFVRTQYLSISAQLAAGLRFLDLRTRVHDDGQLYMYHGGIPIALPHYLQFDAVMGEVDAFLAQSPQETVLVSINNDDTSTAHPPAVFYNAIKTHIARNADSWVTASSTVTLGQARGKSVLLRRFHAPDDVPDEEKIGLDLSGWLDNNADFTLMTASGVAVNLQDHWNYSERIALHALVQSKYTYISNMLDKAAASEKAEWHLNFFSAVGDPAQKGEVAESHWVAVGAHSWIIGKFVEGINPTVRTNYGWEVSKSYGVCALDYPELPKDCDLVAVLVGSNF